MTGWDHEIDARDLLCPLPVLKARKGMARLVGGQVLRVLATDPAAWVDMPHFCLHAGHDLIGTEDLPGGGQAYLIRKGVK